ncbi:MAG: C4-dicarboxylate ABC transporter permease, partial [Mycobacterium sp.]
MDSSSSTAPGDTPTRGATFSPSGRSQDVPVDRPVDDQEKPGRQLHGWTNRLVAVVAFAVAVLTIWQVFRPLSEGSQYYLIVFLAGSLPLVYLVYRSGLPRFDSEDRPSALDWLLAAVTLLVCLYPVLPFKMGSGGGGYNAFLDRQALLEPIDVAMGALLLVLIIE